MSEFYPNSGLSGGLTACSEKDATSGTEPERTLPKVGDAMYIAVDRWGGYNVLNEHYTPSRDSKVVEVEVKSIKEVKITFE